MRYYFHLFHSKSAVHFVEMQTVTFERAGEWRWELGDPPEEQVSSR